MILQQRKRIRVIENLPSSKRKRTFEAAEVGTFKPPEHFQYIIMIELNNVIDHMRRRSVDATAQQTGNTATQLAVLKPTPSSTADIQRRIKRQTEIVMATKYLQPQKSIIFYIHHKNTTLSNKQIRNSG